MSSKEGNSVFKPKKLKDILLEYAVFNFREIFLEKVEDERRMCARKDISLPCGLFESILGKSKEIHWMICAHFLKFCLNARDELRWENIEFPPCSVRGTDLTTDDLKIISESQTTIRSLRFFSNLGTQALVYLSKMKGLEILEIDDGFHFNGMCRKFNCKQKIKLKNLKELTIGFQAVTYDFLENLDLEESSRSLQTLNLLNVYEQPERKIPFLQSLGSLNNVRHLSLTFLYVSHEDSSYDHIGYFQSISNMKHLKTLNLSCWTVPSDSANLLKDLLENVKSIENLDVSWSSFVANHHVWLTRRLKYLGMCDDEISLGNQISLSNINAETIGGNYNLESLLTYMETSIGNEMNVERALNHLESKVKDSILEMTDNMWYRLERILIECLHGYIDIYLVIEIFSVFERTHKRFPIFKRKICSILVNFMIRNLESAFYNGFIFSPGIRNEKIYPHLRDFMIKESNSRVMKNFLKTILWALSEHRDIAKKLNNEFKQVGVIRTFKTMEKDESLDAEVREKIQIIMESLNAVDVNDSDGGDSDADE